MNATVLGVWLILAMAPPALAQRAGDMVSVGVERIVPPDWENKGFTAFVVRHTVLSPERAGLEFGALLAPIGNGIGAVALEFGPAFSSSDGPVLFQARAGLSAMMLILPGLYIGGGITIPVSDPLALRLDATYRTYFWGSESIGFGSLGVGLSFLPGRRATAPKPCDGAAGERP